MMTAKSETIARHVYRPKTYCVRHDSGEMFEVTAGTLARMRNLIEAECADRGWLLTDVDWFEKGEK